MVQIDIYKSQREGLISQNMKSLELDENFSCIHEKSNLEILWRQICKTKVGGPIRCPR